jgi:beta-RFAP synthase
MITLTTASRLHFGLISLATPGNYWSDRAGKPVLPARRFGGVGLMIDRPGIRLGMAPASDWSADGPLAERVLGFVSRFRETARTPLPPQRFTIESTAPEHAGLGTGTQLGLAVARLLSTLEPGTPSTMDLARRVGRGLRSAIGLHGFDRGGFLVEGGQGREGVLAPLLTRHDFPDDWRFLLIRLPQPPGVHGERERAVFARLADDPARSALLCRLVLLGLLPALVERDLPSFAAALGEFNAVAGEPFVDSQGGLHASAANSELIAWLHAQGHAGVGQSSWGPVVFALVSDDDAANRLGQRVRQVFPTAAVEVVQACNAGAQLHDA